MVACGLTAHFAHGLDKRGCESNFVLPKVVCLVPPHTSASKDQISISQKLLLPQLLKIYWIIDMCLTSSGFIERKILSKVCKFS